jgi:glycine C-acetyltransferase/8-amino-7-oxononanoate synthase
MFEKRLTELAAHHLTRRLTPIQSGVGPMVEIAGRQILLLASNDYLGLASHPEVIQSAIEATQQFGAGAGASRLLSGSLPPHQELESALAQFKGTDAALTFSSGYLANIGTIPALIGRDGLILADRLCHASLIDGCRLSTADFRIYRHNDVSHLQFLLAKRRKGRRTLIVTDGLFSMDGDLAPLPELSRLAQDYEADLYIDDAHGTGVMGPHGRGTAEHFGLDTQIPFQMGTLGKAFGSSGAYLAGPATLIRYLINTSRSFIFTTAPPPSSAAAATAALRVMQREPERRERLWANRERLFSGLLQLGFNLSPSVSPIMPILVGNAEAALSFSGHLLAEGVYAPAIRPPTVPDETSRIRVTVTSEHRPNHIDHALIAFQRAGQLAGLI